MSNSTRQARGLREYVSTGCEGLDYLLGGGLRVPPGRPPSLIIKGPPGAGKSTLAAGLAARALSEGRPRADVLYVSLEQRGQDIRSMIGQFGWAPRSWPDGAELLDRWESVRPSAPGEPPRFLISQFPMHTLKAMETLGAAESVCGQEHGPDEDLETRPGDWRREWNGEVELVEHVERVLGALPGCRMIVIDSIAPPPSETSNAPYELRRSMFHRLCKLGADHGAIVTLLLERTGRETWRDYIADVVVDMGWQELRPGELRRFVQVEKARFQPILDGRHELRIERGKGVVCFPALPELLRWEAAQPGAPDSERRLVPFCTHAGFNRMLDGDGGMVLRGSSTLLYGPDATRKQCCVARFLHQGIQEQDEDEGRALLLSAGVTIEAARESLRKYLGLVDWERDSVLDRITILSATQYPGSMNELAFKLLGHIDEERITRVAFSDVAAARFAPEDVLLLKEVCARRGVTSLFVHTVDDGVESPLRESFDTFIRSRHLVLPNEVNVRVGYQVRHWNGTTADRPKYWELRVETIGPDERLEVHVDDCFGEFVERDGRLHRLPLTLNLYGEFEEISTFWRRETEGVFGKGMVKESEEPRVMPFAHQDSDAALNMYEHLATSTESTSTIVGNLDEYWLDYLVGKGKIEPLDDLDLSFAEAFHPQAWRRARVGGKPFAIPHRIDFGIYTVRRDVITDEVLAACGLPPGHDDWTWGQLIHAATVGRELYKGDTQVRAAKELRQEPDKPPLLDVSAEVDESLLCFVLEVLWPFLFPGGSRRVEPRSGIDAEDDSPFAGFGAPDVLAAVQELQGLVVGAGGLARPPCEHPSAITQPAIIQRHWFVTRWRLLHKLRVSPSIAASIQQIRPPRLELEGRRPIARTASICGEWYLGLIKGSPNRGRGLWAIQALTSGAAQRRLYRNGVGLPADDRVWQRSDDRELRESYLTTVSRRSIPGYFEIRPLLVNALRHILTQDVSDRGAPEEATGPQERTHRYRDRVAQVWAELLEDLPAASRGASP